MVEYHCFSCKKYFEVGDDAPTPAKCPLCGGEHISEVTLYEGATVPGLSMGFGIASLVLGPFTGLPAIVLGIIGLGEKIKPVRSSIIGVATGAIGTVGVTLLAGWMFYQYYQESYRANCLLNLSRIGFAEMKSPGQETTNCFATSPALVVTNETLAADLGLTLQRVEPAEAPKPGETNAPVFSCCYSTTWPTSLEALARIGRLSMICPQSRTNYLYVPPPVAALPGVVVMADRDDAHKGRCVLRSNGDVMYLKPEEFELEMKRPQNALFAHALEESLKPPPAKTDTNRAAASATQDVSSAESAPAKR